jgi:hypothetical protein
LPFFPLSNLSVSLESSSFSFFDFLPAFFPPFPLFLPPLVSSDTGDSDDGAEVVSMGAGVTGVAGAVVSTTGEGESGFVTGVEVISMGAGVAGAVVGTTGESEIGFVTGAEVISTVIHEEHLLRALADLQQHFCIFEAYTSDLFIKFDDSNTTTWSNMGGKFTTNKNGV